MAKIRTIKPEFWESEQVGECHPMARLLFICLLNFCDDGGNYPASVKAMKRNAFGYDEVSSDQVQVWMDELITNGLVAVYEAEGKTYWHVTGFSKHQTIGRPFLKHPPFPSDAMSKQCSSIAQTMPEQCSDNVQALHEQCSSIAGKGKEGERKGKETENGKGVVSINAIPKPTARQPDSFLTPPADVVRVFRENGFECQPADPRVREIARQGVDLSSLASACQEAIRSKPGERIPITYPVRILERWARDADGMKVRGARQLGKPKSTQEQLAEYHALKAAQERIVEGHVREVINERIAG